MTAVGHGQNQTERCTSGVGRGGPLVAGGHGIRAEGAGPSNLQPVRKASAEVGRRTTRGRAAEAAAAGGGAGRCERLWPVDRGVIGRNQHPTSRRRDHQRGIEIDRIAVVIGRAGVARRVRSVPLGHCPSVAALPVFSRAVFVGGMFAVMVIGSVISLVGPSAVMMAVVVVMMVQVAGQMDVRRRPPVGSAAGNRLRQGNPPQQQLKQHRRHHRNPPGRPEKAGRHTPAKSNVGVGDAAMHRAD